MAATKRKRNLVEVKDVWQLTFDGERKNCRKENGFYDADVDDDDVDDFYGSVIKQSCRTNFRSDFEPVN